MTERVMDTHISIKKLTETVILCIQTHHMTGNIQFMREALGPDVEALVSMVDTYIKVTCHRLLVFASVPLLLDNTILKVRVVLIISHHHM